MYIKNLFVLFTRIDLIADRSGPDIIFLFQYLIQKCRQVFYSHGFQIFLATTAFFFAGGCSRWCLLLFSSAGVFHQNAGALENVLISINRTAKPYGQGQSI